MSVRVLTTEQSAEECYGTPQAWPAEKERSNTNPKIKDESSCGERLASTCTISGICKDPVAIVGGLIGGLARSHWVCDLPSYAIKPF